MYISESFQIEAKPKTKSKAKLSKMINELFKINPYSCNIRNYLYLKRGRIIITIKYIDFDKDYEKLHIIYEKYSNDFDISIEYFKNVYED